MSVTVYTCTTEQLTRRQAIVERVRALQAEAVAALTDLACNVTLDATYRDGEADEFGDHPNRMTEAISPTALSRAYDEMVGRVLDWRPDHGDAVTACPDGEYGA